MNHLLAAQSSSISDNTASSIRTNDLPGGNTFTTRLRHLSPGLARSCTLLLRRRRLSTGEVRVGQSVDPRILEQVGRPRTDANNLLTGQAVELAHEQRGPLISNTSYSTASHL